MRPPTLRLRPLVPLFLLLLAAVPAAADDRLTAETFRGLELRNIGPALMSGRIADLAVHPGEPSTWYVAAGSGGVWKTVNAGATWTPVFDDQKSYSIGCVTLDPKAPEVVWVGTGENVSGRHVGYGDGVYKSLDGGKSWTNVGLGKSEHVAKILVDPRDSDVVYVAAEGPLWSSGGERGVYKSTDGGASWTAVLTLDDDAGVTDLEMDPDDPDVLYAAAYQRRRHVWAFLAGGPRSGVYKSVDGGASWRRLENGLPKGDVGKIGLAVSPVDPRLVYATIEAGEDEKGFYRSEDRGGSWEKRSDYTSGGTGGHYYQEIYASPHQADRVYQMDVWIQVTQDGGKTFSQLPENTKHSDSHALAFDPDDPDRLLVGSDGGLYETFDHGASWRFHANLPLTQFYKLALDNDVPFYNVVGGTQDNGTQLGPSRTANGHGVMNSDWVVAVSADGYACAIDPEDPNTVYGEWQGGGLTRYDKATGQRLDVKAQPGPDEPPERWNWDAPVLVSPHSHTRLYHGSQRLWRSDDRGDSWRTVSGDLTRGLSRYELEIFGRVWSVDALYDNYAMSVYATTTAVSESPLVEGLIYVGTDDGLVQVTEDGGASWRRQDRFPGVPEMSFVNDVRASAHDADTVYAVLDAHQAGDYSPYVLRSTDRGHTWTSIAGDPAGTGIPARHLVWSLVEDPVAKDLLFAGTEYGIFFTLDGGRRWIRLEGGVPTIAFRDLEIQEREGDLVGASFGRGFFILDDVSPLRHVSAELLAGEAALFPVRTAKLYVPSMPLDLPGKAFQGDAFYLGANPPFGAVFTYYLRDELRTSKAKRRAEEKAIREEGGDVPFPGWERLKAEEREDEPAIVLTVTAQDGPFGGDRGGKHGHVVRRVTGPATKGIHRVAWDLRYPPPYPTRLEPWTAGAPWDEPPIGPLAPPGRYTVELARLADGELTALAEAQTFAVVPLAGTGDAAEWQAISAFQRRTADLLRRATGVAEAAEEAAERLEHLDKALLASPAPSVELLAQARALDLRLRDLRERLTGDPTRGRFAEPAAPSILGRLSGVAWGHWSTTHGPTRTHRDSLAVAEEQFERTSEALRELIETDLPRLEAAAEEAGAPWTPGRGVPR